MNQPDSGTQGPATGCHKMSVADAKLHLDEAMRFLTLEAYRGNPNDMERVDDFLIAEDLERIDRQIGSTGASVFWNIAQSIRAAYVEVKAARAALGENLSKD